MAVGQCKLSATNIDFAVARDNTNGSLDTSFDTDGKLNTPFGSTTDTANAVAIQPDGKIIVAGSTYNGTNDDFALARYNVDGSLDASFSFDGKRTSAFGSGKDVRGVALQADGKIVVAGSINNGTNDDFAVVRFEGLTPMGPQTFVVDSLVDEFNENTSAATCRCAKPSPLPTPTRATLTRSHSHPH